MVDAVVQEVAAVVWMASKKAVYRSIQDKEGWETCEFRFNMVDDRVARIYDLTVREDLRGQGFSMAVLRALVHMDADRMHISAFEIEHTAVDKELEDALRELKAYTPGGISTVTRRHFAAMDGGEIAMEGEEQPQPAPFSDLRGIAKNFPVSFLDTFVDWMLSNGEKLVNIPKEDTLTVQVVKPVGLSAEFMNRSLEVSARLHRGGNCPGKFEKVQRKGYYRLSLEIKVDARGFPGAALPNVGSYPRKFSASMEDLGIELVKVMREKMSNQEDAQAMDQFQFMPLNYMHIVPLKDCFLLLEAFCTTTFVEKIRFLPCLNMHALPYEKESLEELRVLIGRKDYRTNGQWTRCVCVYVCLYMLVRVCVRVCLCICICP